MLDITLAEKIKSAGYNLLFVYGDIKSFNEYIDSLVKKKKEYKEYCSICGRLMIGKECIKSPHSPLELGLDK